MKKKEFVLPLILIHKEIMTEEINPKIKQRIIFFIKQKNYSAAEQLIAKAIKKYSNSMYLKELLAYCHYEKGEYEDAIRSYNLILKSDIEVSYEIFLFLGNSLGNLGFRKEAIIYLEKSLVNNPSKSSSLNNLGIQHELLKDFNKAAEYYNKSIEHNINFELGYTNLAGIKEKLGNTQESLGLYEKCLKLNSNNTAALLGLANLYLITKSYDEAYNLFTKVLKIDSSIKKAYTGLGNILLSKGDYIEGLKMLQKGIGVIKFIKGNDLKIISS